VKWHLIHTSTDFTCHQCVIWLRKHWLYLPSMCHVTTHKHWLYLPSMCHMITQALTLPAINVSCSLDCSSAEAIFDLICWLASRIEPSSSCRAAMLLGRLRDEALVNTCTSIRNFPEQSRKIRCWWCNTLRSKFG